MPSNVRLKILAALLGSISVLILIFVSLGWAAALTFLLIGILYTETLNHRWNFFGERMIADVRSHGVNAVALSFDDGPSPWTLPILESLSRANVKATFFLLGKNVEKYPEIARR